jgi:hypothetical protein
LHDVCPLESATHKAGFSGCARVVGAALISARVADKGGFW